MEVYEIYNDRDEKVGEVTCHPATVLVEQYGDPIKPQYRIIDFNGNPVLSPEEEKKKLVNEQAQLEARLKALKELTKEEKKDDKKKEETKPGETVL